MKVKIGISQLNEKGCLSFLENDDGEMIELVRMDSLRDVETLCMISAKNLRKLADKFDALADRQDAFSESTQVKVNYGHIQ